MGNKKRLVPVWSRLSTLAIIVTICLGLFMPVSFSPQIAHAATTDLYWVGGSGDWGNQSHWANASGEIGGVATPTPALSVHFDANSFTDAGQVVTFNVPGGECYSMDWTGATNHPTFAGDSGYNIHIYGSLTFISDMSITFAGEMQFWGSDTGRTIKTNGLVLSSISNLHFVDLGSWSLAGPIDIGASEFVLSKGNFSTNGYQMSGRSLWMNTGPCTIDLGSSAVSLSGGWHYDYSATGFVLNAGTSTLNIAGSTFDGGNFAYNVVNLTGSAAISGNNTFNELNLSPGTAETIIFTDGTTQTVAAANLSGSSGHMHTLQGTGSGGWTISYSGAGNVTSDYISVFNSNANPPSTWYCDINSKADSYSTSHGWTQIPLTDLYWVGGTGNWSDNTNHWSMTSGGSPGAPLPSRTTNVHFDANSFTGTGQVVTFDENGYECYNMDWIGATNHPTFAGNLGYNIHIFGSLTFISDMSITFAGEMQFWGSDTGKTINTNGLVLSSISNLSFKDPGSWSLAGPIDIGDSEFVFSKGNFSTNGYSMSGRNLWMNTGPCTIDLGSSVVSLSHSWHYDYSATGFALNAGTSTLNIAGSTFDGGNLAYNVVNLTGSNVAISGNNTFNELNLSPGTAQTITFPEGTTQTVAAANLSGNSLQHMHTLQGSASGIWTISYSGAGNVTSDYISVINSNGIPANTWYYGRNSSADSYSRANGWAPPPTTDEYWVGGTGNWSDNTNHWSWTSGGTPGAPLPSRTTNVHFDANSFTDANQIVTFDVAGGECYNMDWTGATNNPTFAGNSTYNIHIYGSLTFISDMSITFAGQIAFWGTATGQTITTNGLDLSSISYMYFNGDGSWSLNDDLNLGTTNLGISFSYGNFTTNNHTITCAGWLMDSGGPYTINLGSSTVNAKSWRYNASGATLNAGTSTLNIAGGAYFQGGGFTYNIVNLNSSITVDGNNTFNQLNLSPGTTQTITFADGTTQTVAAANLSGSPGYIHTLRATRATPGGNWTIAYSGTGNITSDYISVFNSNGTPANTWYYEPNSSSADPYSQDNGWASAVAPITLPTSGYFTIAVLPDTQLYSAGHPEIFDNQTQWIVDNAQAQNIVFVAGLGDIVNDSWVPAEWTNAVHSYGIIRSAGIPYSVVPGNHDLNGSEGNTSYFDTYFPYTDFTGYSWYVGNSSAGYSSNYELFSALGQNFIILNIACTPNLESAAESWANSILTTYSSRQAIVITHGYIDMAGNYTDDSDVSGIQVWNDIVKYHSNVIMVLCGHMFNVCGDDQYHGSATGVNGNTIYNLLTDYQDCDNGGDGWLRLYRFYPSINTLSAVTYSPYLDQYDWTTGVTGGRFDLPYPPPGVAVAPLVTTQPGNQTVTVGGTATFTAAASGTPDPTVQWQVSSNGGSNWGNITGETNATLNLTSVTLGQNGYQYHAVFTNIAGTDTSNAATLTVNVIAPTVTTQPGNQTVTVGGTATFTAAASGTPDPTVQWQVSTNGGSTWGNITGKTNATLTLTSVTLDQNGYQYHAVFTNIAGTATSNAATLTVNSIAPSVTTDPASDITTNSATLNGNVTSLGTATSVAVSFEWGLTDSYGNETTPQTVAAGPFSANLPGLAPGTTYHFKAKAAGDGTSYGNDTTFATQTLYQIRGVTGEVNCALLPGASVDLYSGAELVGSTTSESNGNYTLTVSELGTYQVVVTKAGFRGNITQPVSITGAGEYTLDFTGETGLVPNAPDMSYVLSCINHWIVPEPPCSLTMSKVLEVINAWIIPN